MRNPLPSDVLEQLQRLLQTDGMFTLVTDRRGIQSDNGQKSILQFIVQDERLWLLTKEQWLHKIEQLNRPVTVELELPGLFVNVAPIKMNQNVFYLWAIEGLALQAKEQLLDFIAVHYELPNEWHNILQSIPATEKTNREKVLHKLELAVQLAVGITGSRVAGALSLQQFEAILKAAESLKKGSLAVCPILGELIASPPESFFCGYAEALENGEYCVTEMLNAGQKQMIGATFQIGEGFLGQASMIGEYLSWQQIETDPRSQFFIRYNIVPSNLSCVPIKKNDGYVRGLIFFGSSDASYEPSEMSTLIRIFAELYGFQLSLDDLEYAYQKQKIYLSSLIEIAKLVTIIQDIKSLLTVLVDVGINLVEDARSSLFMFLFPGKTKANIVSRGIQQEQAQLYCKDLIGRYVGITAQIKEPVIADAPWGETALECPITYRSEVRGVICVFLPKTQRVEQYADVFQAFMTLTNMAIERAIQKDEDTEKKREIALLYESMGQWNKEQHQLHAKARLLATEFAEAISLGKEDISLISSACLISSYSTDFLTKHFADERQLIELIHEYRDCIQAAEKRHRDPFSSACQVMALVYTYLNEDEEPDSIRTLQHIPLKMRESFIRFIMKRQPLEFETTIDTERANERKILDFDELIQQYKLSSREQEVYELVAKGLSNRDIAETLFISEHTVKNHITNLFQKLNVSDRAQAIALAYRTNNR